MNWSKKLRLCLLMLLVSLLTTSCGYYVRLAKRQPVSELCLPEALEECVALSEPSTESMLETAVKWSAEYRLCQLKHKILIECTKEASK